MVGNRYDRQVLAFGRDGQEQLEAARVGIVGLGGIGSHIAQGLAYLGVKDFVLVDDDYVDTTNLNRLVTAFPADAAAKKPKVDAAERQIKLINPEATVAKTSKNLRSREALTGLTSCPTVFGCVDHDAPRLILTELAAAYKLTLIDSATEIAAESGHVREFGGRVVVARPGLFCLDCAGQIDMEVAKQELSDPLTRQVRKEFGYGLGEDGESPSVVSLNGVIAGLAITEFVVSVTGIREPYDHLQYHGFRGRVNIRTDQRRQTCYTCGSLTGTGEKANILRYALD